MSNIKALNNIMDQIEDVSKAIDTLETAVSGDDPINPNYYVGGIETTKYILSHKLNFCEGNIIKYVTRYKNKNGLEDLLKAKKYLELLIEDFEHGD
jgi:hypothetical protein